MDNLQKKAVIEEYLKKADEVDYSVQLPETELEVMNAVWKLRPPVTTAMLMEEISVRHTWKTPTLISFLLRLEEKGFIISYKTGKERCYIPVAERDIYMSRMAVRFVDRFFGGSFTDFLDSLYLEKDFAEEIDELAVWLKKRCGGVDDNGDK